MDKTDAHFKLADAYWRDFNERRTYEWKVNFALWASLAAFAAIVAKGELGLALTHQVVFTLMIISIFLIFWLFWATGLRKRNFRNLRAAYDEWNAIRQEFGLEFTPTENEVGLWPWLENSLPTWMHPRLKIWTHWAVG
jgi:hypothetical protein